MTTNPNQNRPLSEYELDGLLQESLDRLHLMCSLFPKETSISLAMATEIWNVLEGRPGRRILRSITFPAPRMYVDGIRNDGLFPIVGIRLEKEPPTIAFDPLLSALPSGMIYDMLPFNEWWEKEIAYQPLREPNDGEEVNVQDLTRRGVIKVVRNKIGAHHDTSRPKLLDELSKSLSIERWSFEMYGQKRSLGDGVLNVATPYLHAIIRQVAHEVLVAFGRES